MTPKEIATTIMQRRETSMSPIIMPGEIQQTLGADGYSEALRQRWLEPNPETGYVQVTNNMTLVDQMSKLRESVIQEDSFEPGDVVDVGGQECVVNTRMPDGTYTVISPGGDQTKLNRAITGVEMKLISKNQNKGPVGQPVQQPTGQRPLPPAAAPASTGGSGAPPGGGAPRSLTPGVGAT